MSNNKVEKFNETGEVRFQHCSNVEDNSDCSICFSGAEEQPCHSPINNSHCAARLSIDGVQEPCRSSCVSEFSVDLDTVEAGGVAETIIDISKIAAEKDCRICHLGLVSGAPEPGIPIELGCSCKDDLAAAHKQCAETWFKIKGNKTCEICGSLAKNVTSPANTEYAEQPNETINSPAAAASVATETRSFWQGHRFLNFLLACMVFAFVVSWLFHFNVPG